MSISNFPTVLQAAIQQNFLQRLFWDGLVSQLGYRDVAIKVPFPNNIGETYTATKTSMLVPQTTALDPSANTGLDNGLTPSQWAVEQYTMSLNMYGDTMNLNIFTQQVGIADQFLQNANKLGVEAGQTIDRLAGMALRNAYLSGNTIVTATLGAPAATIAVDDVRGFQTVFVNGVPTAVSSSHVLPIKVNGVAYNIIGFTVDVTNVSSTAVVGGVSGTITASANISVANGTLNNTVIANDAPLIIRPNNRTSWQQLQPTDLLTMKQITAGKTQLKRNNVPKINGYYNVYLDDIQLDQLYQDPVFLQWHRGQVNSPEYQSGVISELLGVRIISTTEAPIQLTGTTLTGGVHRAIMCGEGTLYEGDYAGVETFVKNSGDMEMAEVEIIEGVVFVVRPPLDRLAQIIGQSYFWAGGFVAPTDVLASTSIIPTATPGRYKRAVVIETA